jgi:hypothetical protein
MKTYAKKFNAQRAARAAGLKDDEFEIVKAKGGYAYKPKTVEPIVAEKVKLANKSKDELADEIGQRLRNGGKRAAAEAAAKKGVLPEPPDFSANTHARFRSKLGKLIELAEAGDIAGLKAVKINPVSTSPKAMARYRDLCVAALEAKQAS